MLNEAKTLGLREEDFKSALEYLEYNEWGLAFDTAISQMYEYNIKVDQSFYDRVSEIAAMMKLDEKEFLYMKELIRKTEI